MDLTTQERMVNDDACILSVEGDVDVYTSPQLKQEIINLAADGVKRLVIDLSKVEYMDSTGLAVLISALKRLRQAGGSLALVGPDRRITRIFEITGLDKVFDVYPSETDAVAGEGVAS